MMTDAQVRLLRKKRMQGMTMEAAAAAAAMSERTARSWQSGPLPSQTKHARDWRTRPDPFVAVWAGEVEPLLRADEDGKLEAKTIFDELQRRHPDEFEAGQLRTLQRHVRLWRAQQGPGRAVMFPQEHLPGRTAAMDFTRGDELGITIAGVLFAHLLFEFVLAFSGWRYVQLAFGETYEALLSCLQGALWTLGGVPERMRMDNLSAATHELLRTHGRSLTTRFAAVLDHYGMESSRIQPGEGHENGVAEKAHDLLKSAIDQRLRLRGHRDFASVEHYLAFVRELVDETFHRGRQERIAQERACLRPLPASRLPEHTSVRVRVRSWSTISLGKRIYSVPSRLIGHEVEARQYADVVEIHLAGQRLETMPRLRGEQTHRIDYRHVIWSLVRKPGAFAAYRFREELFPTLTFRRAYDALRASRADRADVEYVRILHLAASTMEHVVDAALCVLLDRGEPFDYVAVKALAHPEQPAVPVISIGLPDLAPYDQLLVAGDEP